MMKLAIAVPCYNEQEVLDETNNRLTQLIDRLLDQGKVNPDSRIYYIDDGSTDRTWDIIENLSKHQPSVTGIKLSRNVGHQHALLAGLLTAEGDAIVSIDADLQDDVSVIEQMVDDFNLRKVQIVYGVRKQRNSDSFFKRTTADLFYKVLRLMGGEIIQHHADFRLMGRPAIEGLREFNEVNLFLRGIIPLLGFKSSIVYYDRTARFAGTSKYPFKKMLALALNGITSFSVVPLRMITALGFVVFLLSAVMGIWVLTNALLTDAMVPGWASTILPIYFLGGIQVLCIGVLGEYIGKIYKETKQRPRYFIEKTTD
ncbi:glycosyltransferase family 2 protein [Methylomicrobium lacus]|uniref:glycosyltransferase family 2 protein n=1 Tax=Methylomicrobium lacus TaxID=136992 RepID=UPI0035A92D87